MPKCHPFPQVMQEFGYDETYAVASSTWAILAWHVDGHVDIVMVMLWLCYDMVMLCRWPWYQMLWLCCRMLLGIKGGWRDRERRSAAERPAVRAGRDACALTASASAEAMLWDPGSVHQLPGLVN